MYWLGEPLSRPATARKELVEFVPPKGLRWYITDKECNQLYPDDEPMLPIDYHYGLHGRMPVVEKNWHILKKDIYKPWVTFVFLVPYVILDEERIERGHFPLRSKVAFVKDDEIQKIINPVFDAVSILRGMDAIVLKEKSVDIPSFMIRPRLVQYFSMEEVLNTFTDESLPWHERVPMEINVRRYTLLNELIRIIDESFS